MYIERSSKASHRPSISGLKHDTLWSVLHSKTDKRLIVIAKKAYSSFPLQAEAHQMSSLPFSLFFLSPSVASVKNSVFPVRDAVDFDPATS